MTLASLLILVAAAPPSLVPDGRLQQLITDSRNVGEVSPAFEKTDTATLDGKTSTIVARYDPSHPPAWRVISIDGKPPAAKISRDIVRENESKPVPSYGRVALLLEGARPIDATHFRLDHLPKGFLGGRGGKYSDHLIADLTVDLSGGRPFVSETRTYSPAPFAVRIVATLDRFSVVTRYALAPDGRPRVATQDIVFDVSYPGGKFTSVSKATFRPL